MPEKRFRFVPADRSLFFFFLSKCQGCQIPYSHVVAIFSSSTHLKVRLVDFLQASESEAGSVLTVRSLCQQTWIVLQKQY